MYTFSCSVLLNIGVFKHEHLLKQIIKKKKKKLFSLSVLVAEERVMLPLLELAVESSDVTIPSVPSCFSACAWLAMLPKTTGRA